ncbi:hypothetical protein EIP91_001014 [Steccherinum ochraceum]|uniref:Secreted protein n=1 Tax=Steccherinum ochraceum TaxID=92696 RepID=A0A4R0REX2_9APHY|nr:hypothetical protein EIP91_001014 [Steccherinum ochraceum]
MRLTIILGGLLTIAASSAAAVPLHHYHARGYDENALTARHYNLVVRDVLRAIHARELAELDARTVEFSSDLTKREPPRRPSSREGSQPNPARPADTTPREQTAEDVTRAMNHNVGTSPAAEHNRLVNTMNNPRPAPPPQEHNPIIAPVD